MYIKKHNPYTYRSNQPFTIAKALRYIEKQAVDPSIQGLFHDYISWTKAS